MTESKKVLHLDIETYSDLNLSTGGVYKYAAHKSFKILLIAYAYAEEGEDITRDDVEIIDVEQSGFNSFGIQKIIEDIADAKIIKKAYNAQFERICFNSWIRRNQNLLGTRFLGKDIFINNFLNPISWRCSMVEAAYYGLPMGLDAVCKAIKAPKEFQKDIKGGALIRKFSINGKNHKLPEEEPEEWELYKEYCIGDVVAECYVDNYIHKKSFKISEKEHNLYCLDQIINDRGIKIDRNLANTIIELAQEEVDKLTLEFQQLTGADSPKSATQIKSWLLAAEGKSYKSIGKAVLPEIIESLTSETSRRVMEIRKAVSKSSVAKYQAMINYASEEDDRIRGLYQFYGASRTGRWAGRGVQLQNLPKIPYKKNLDNIRNLVLKKDIEELQAIGYEPMALFSSLIRTCLVAEDNARFIVADYSQIEARILAYLAKEQWRIDILNKGEVDLYEASASKMFSKTIEEVRAEDLRQSGKIAELALGYGGSLGALIQMGADKTMEEDELTDLVRKWRKANPKIVNYWDELDTYFRTAMSDGYAEDKNNNIKFTRKDNNIYITLPDGRFLTYISPRLVEGQYGLEINYEGQNSKTKQWGLEKLYGGKIAENITQAIARDCLAGALLRMGSLEGIVSHTHDEIVIETLETAQYRLDNEKENMFSTMKSYTCLGGLLDLILDCDGSYGAYYNK